MSGITERRTGRLLITSRGQCLKRRSRKKMADHDARAAVVAVLLCVALTVLTFCLEPSRPVIIDCRKRENIYVLGRFAGSFPVGTRIIRYRFRRRRLIEFTFPGGQDVLFSLAAAISYFFSGRVSFDTALFNTNVAVVLNRSTPHCCLRSRTI